MSQQENKASETKERSPQEVIQGLENDYNDAVRKLLESQEAVLKAKDAVSANQEATFKAFQLLSNGKERFLMSVVTQLRDQANAQSAELNKLKSELGKTEEPASVRPDNL